MDKGQNVNEMGLPNFWIALIPIVFMAAALFVGIGIFGQDPQLPLVFSTIVAVIVALRLGHTWKSLETSIIKTISAAITALLILVVVGAFIGVWMAGGIVPAMIYYGLEILSPTWYLLTACIITLVVSCAGNSWFAAGTIGIALMAIGKGLGLPLPMVAGAIVSGAYFGDKCSPLSDLTNFTAGVVGINLFDHIRNLLNTTIPTMIITLIIYTFMGFAISGKGSDLSEIATIQQILSDQFVISPWLLLPLLFIVLIFIFKIPALPGLTIGVVLGALCAVYVQGYSWGDAMFYMNEGFSIETGNEITDSLLNNGGILEMAFVITLILIALSFGAVIQKARFLEALLGGLISRIQRTGSMITATAATCWASNAIGCDQFMSVIIPANMYKDEYKKRGLHPKLLARTVEDCGTVMASLLPWTTCGIFMYSVLGVSPVQYAPYAFFCYLGTFVAIVFGYLNIKINRLPEKDQPIDSNVGLAMVDSK